MITEEQCKNCDGMGYLFDEDLLFVDDKDKKVCPVVKSSTSTPQADRRLLDFTHTTSCHVCFGIGYIFHYKRGSYENKNA